MGWFDAHAVYYTYTSFIILFLIIFHHFFCLFSSSSSILVFLLLLFCLFCWGIITLSVCLLLYIMYILRIRIIYIFSRLVNSHAFCTIHHLVYNLSRFSSIWTKSDFKSWYENCCLLHFAFVVRVKRYFDECNEYVGEENSLMLLLLFSSAF